MTEQKALRLHPEDAIRQSQCTAPPHHFRFVEVKTIGRTTHVSWLHDFVSKRKALLAAYMSYDGPDTSFQVFDDQGHELIPA